MGDCLILENVGQHLVADSRFQTPSNNPAPQPGLLAGNRTATLYSYLTEFLPRHPDLKNSMR